MFKAIVLVRRKNGFPIEDFHRAWRESAEAGIAKAPALTRYLQNHTLLQGYKHSTLLFDSVDELWFDSLAARNEFLTWGDSQLRGADTLIDASVTAILPVDVHVAKDGNAPQGGVKSFEFVNRKTDMEMEEFRS